MWQWLLIPAGAYVASRLIKKAAETPAREGAEAEETAGGPRVGEPRSSIGRAVPRPPALWPVLERWIAALSRRDEAPPRVSPVAIAADAEEAPVGWRRWVTPTSLCWATLAALLAVVAAGGGVPGPGLELTQAVLMGALVGIGTNAVAIKMLFRPLERHPALRIQGVIPANRELIVDQLAEGVARNLLDPGTIRQAIHESDAVSRGLEQFIDKLRSLIRSGEFKGDVAELVRGYARALVHNPVFRREVVRSIAAMARRLPERLSWIPEAWEEAMSAGLELFVAAHGDEILAAVDEHVEESVDAYAGALLEWLEALPEEAAARREAIEGALTHAVADWASSFDVASIVRDKLATFDPLDLERLVLSATDTHLAKLQYFGWLLGALVPAAVWLITAALG